MKKDEEHYYSCDMTVYLAMDNYAHYNALLQEKYKRLEGDEELKYFHLGEGIDFVYFKETSKIPKWFNRIFDGIDQFTDVDESNLKSRIAKALLFIKITTGDTDNSRLFVLSFGNGRYLLDMRKIEKHFGLVSSLNMVEARRLRSIDYNTFGAVQKQSRIQSSEYTGLDNLSFDSEQDMIKAVTGKASNSGNDMSGKIVSGNDSFHITTGYDLENIKDILAKLYSKYTESSYQTKFPGIDNIKTLDAHDGEVEFLDLALAAKLIEGEDGVSMSIPEITDWSEIKEFEIGFEPSSVTLNDLVISDVIEKIQQSDRTGIELIEYLGDIKVTANGDDGNALDKCCWSLYDCLYTELQSQDGEKTCFLHNGEWYKIDLDLQRNVDNFFYANLNASRNLETIFDDASWKKNDDGSFKYGKHRNPLIESEGDYNHDMGQKPNFALMDKQEVYVEGQDNFEFCDLLYSGHLADGKLDLIHIKEGLSSSKLSHLFNQGEVSARSLLNPRLQDKILDKYIKCTNEKEWKDEYIPFFNNVDAHNFRIVYAIIDTHEELKIPFFSKVVFRARAKLLEMQGFKVAIVKIKTEDKPPKGPEQEEQG